MWVSPAPSHPIGIPLFFIWKYVSNFAETYDYLKKLGVTKKINNSKELGLSLVEEFNQNKAKNYQIAEKIENHGQNILNNVTMELKKYI